MKKFSSSPAAEENGSIVLSPIRKKPNIDELFGMFSDGKLSSEEFIKQKAIELEKYTIKQQNIYKNRHQVWYKFIKKNKDSGCK
ncbi:hypothetical protein ACYULU_00865 [Breznakiellaceae bacterium SP9]